MLCSINEFSNFINSKKQYSIYLFNSLMQDKTPHALLFLGENKEEKKYLAIALCLKLLCQNFNIDNKLKLNLNNCSTCNRIISNNHINVKWYNLDKIGIEFIRQLNYELCSYSYEDGPQIWIITQSHKMTKSAANSFLKHIEEPKSNRYIVLFAPNEKLLLPTITSRCQKIFFPNIIQKHNKKHILSESIFNQIYMATIKEKFDLIDNFFMNKEESISLLNDFSKLIINKIKDCPESLHSNRILLEKIMKTTHQINKNINIRLLLEKLIIDNWNKKYI